MRLASPPLPPPAEVAHADFELVVRRLADDLAFGTDVSRFVGAGLEFAKSRPYEPGDSMRMIDWRVTARLGKPFVKEHETLKRTAIHIVVDTSASMGVGSTPLTKHDLAIWIAGTVGLAGQRRLSPVALIGGGERGTRFEPSLRSSDLWRALDPLRAPGLAEQTRLADRLEDLDVRIARSSVIIVLSDLHDPGTLPALRHAAQRHDCLAIHLVDPAERGRLRAGFFRGQEAETGRTFLATGFSEWGRASAMAGECARSGVSYLRLQTDEEFVPPLRQFLAFRPGSGGGRG